MSSQGLGLRIVLVCVAGGVLSLTGCGGSGTPGPISCGLVCNGGGGSTGSVGVVHAGTQAVVGATVQLYAVGSTGNGSAATPMLTKTLTTDSGGGFSLTGAYTCGQSSSGASIPSPSNQVYLVATGGSVGGGTANSSLVLMTALGTCSGVGALSTITVNEVTTAAAAWALAPFTVSATNIGGSATNTLGIQNAFLNAGLLASVTTGNAATLSTGLTVESGKLYSLANALSGCAVSSGGTGCSALFAAATPAGGTAPANTLAAALNIVKHPGQNVVPVYQAAAATHSYSGALTAAPNDWTMSLKVTGGGILGPTQLGVDTQGNVWVADYFGAVSAFTNQGKALSSAAAGALSSGGFGNGTLSGIYGLAVDLNDNIFVTNQLIPNTGTGNTGSLSILNGVTSGNTIGSLVTNNVASSPGFGTPYFYDASLQYPEYLATDTNGNIFIGNDNGASYSYATVYSSSGALVQSGLGIPFGSDVFAVSADQAHGVWMASEGDGTVTHADASRGILSTSSCYSEPVGVATDAQGNAWVANYLPDGNGDGTISEIGPGCDTNTIGRSSLCIGPGSNVILLNQLPVAGLHNPQGVAVDAAQNIWMANLHPNSGESASALVEIAGGAGTKAVGTALSPAGGYGLDAGMSSPFSLAPDAAGNVWVSDSVGNALYMFFGLATPSITPVGPTPSAP